MAVDVTVFECERVPADAPAGYQPPPPKRIELEGLRSIGGKTPDARAAVLRRELELQGYTIRAMSHGPGGITAYVYAEEPDAEARERGRARTGLAAITRGAKGRRQLKRGGRS